MMQKQILIAVVWLCIGLCCCAPKAPEDRSKILAKVNTYRLTQDEFQSQLAQELEFEDDYKLTSMAKEAFLEELIRKELLIQEAKRRKLDQEEKFVRAIERYWESTLIRGLLDLKNREIESKTLVTQEEIEQLYTEMKIRDKNLPALADLEKGIEKELKEKKQSEMLENWIKELRDKAQITIDKSLL